jgi:hypothetical protein
VRYEAGRRRTLLDMHIPDWDPAFLAKYDPVALADTYKRANITSAMLYCKSHVGLCYWPTPVGKMHANLAERDAVGELVDALRARDIGVCAYYSVVFDNWAATEHPDWRQVTISGNDYQGLIRYGVCCQNNPEYRAYEHAQLTDLLGRYEVDALFLDMVFWPFICCCEHCRARYRDEAGADIPETVDWMSPAWCRFQRAREGWSDEFAQWLFAVARAARPNVAVTHNLAPSLMSWVQAQPVLASNHDTFVAGDLYGDRVEQLMVSKLIAHLGQQGPPEFMTSRTVDLSDHERVKSSEQMLTYALAAPATGSALLFIDAIDPSGEINADMYDRIGPVFAESSRYEPWIGGEPVEDVAVYYSVDSQMNFEENGTPVAAVNAARDARHPHIRAVRGACGALQRAHVPFGVITSRELGSLHRYAVVVLPNVLRMSADEVAAFRAYVNAGGTLYASGWTSLVSTDGAHHDDFQLADVFGVSLDGEEAGPFIYLKPVVGDDDSLLTEIAPQRYLSRPIRGSGFGPPKQRCGVPRVRATTASALATVTLPYGYPARGNVLDRQWASIHSSPPWLDTGAAAIVTNSFGAGRAIYSIDDIESTDAWANENVFVWMVNSLLAGRARFAAAAHPSIWINAFDQTGQRRMLVTLFANNADPPPSVQTARFAIPHPRGQRFVRVTEVPGGRELPFNANDMRIDFDVEVERLTMLLCEY